MAGPRNLTKVEGSDKLLPRLAQTMDGWRKHDPATSKKLPIGVDIPEWIANEGRRRRCEKMMATGDLTLIAFYYLLRVGEYTVKGTRNESKQTQQFRCKDVTFFARDQHGQLRQLGRRACDTAFLGAASATLRIRNQKNGWKNVCINQETNGQAYCCGLKALARQYIHIRDNTTCFEEAQETFLSAYWEAGKRRNITNKDVSGYLKEAAEALNYHETRGIHPNNIDTHSLRAGGANALALSGYSDSQIMKMGRWRSSTFMEYIRDELSEYSKGMATKMSRKFTFVNIAGGTAHDVTSAAMITPCNTGAAAAA